METPNTRLFLSEEDAASVKEKLLFARGVLSILKDTDLFGPMIDQAIDDLDDLLSKVR